MDIKMLNTKDIFLCQPRIFMYPKYKKKNQKQMKGYNIY